MLEEWKIIPSYPWYEASDQGQVRSWISNNKKNPERNVPLILKPANVRGYHGYKLYIKPGTRTFEHVLGHVVVLEAFGFPRPDGLVVRHLDGTRNNNRLANLLYGTPSENALDSVAHGTCNIMPGELHDNARLKVADIIAIRSLYKQGWSYLAIADKFGISEVHTMNIVARRKWRSVPENTEV